MLIHWTKNSILQQYPKVVLTFSYEISMPAWLHLENCHHLLQMLLVMIKINFRMNFTSEDGKYVFELSPCEPIPCVAGESEPTAAVS